MPQPPVALNIRPTLTLPQTVVLPISIHKAAGVNRRFVISTRDQKVAPAIADWLRNDTQYRQWFDEAGTADPLALATESLTGGDAPMWSTAMPVPALRVYAGANKVLLEKSDKRDDILIKLRAAGKPMLVDEDTQKWQESMSIEALHEYATNHGVKLESDDNKQDIYDKLRRAVLPEETEAAT